MRFVVVAGNPKPQSRTLAAARQAAAAITGAAGLAGGYQVADLSGLGPRLLRPEPSPAVEDALEQVTGADVVLVASPTYKGTYTGLLKVFLDRLPHRALDGVTALPLLVMGAPQHALAVDVYLRPLLLELGATVPVPGLALLESELANPESVLLPWAARAAAMIARAPVAALASQPPVPA